MTATEMISKVETRMQSVSGYSYNGKILRETIECGYRAIPEGSTLMSRGGQMLKLIGGCVTCWADGKQTKSSPVADEKTMDAVIMMYAETACQACTKMGSF